MRRIEPSGNSNLLELLSALDVLVEFTPSSGADSGVLEIWQLDEDEQYGLCEAAVSRLPLITEDEWSSLVLRIKNHEPESEDAWRRIVQGHLHVVFSIVSSYSVRNVSTSALACRGIWKLQRKISSALLRSLQEFRSGTEWRIRSAFLSGGLFNVAVSKPPEVSHLEIPAVPLSNTPVARRSKTSRTDAFDSELFDRELLLGLLFYPVSRRRLLDVLHEFPVLTQRVLDLLFGIGGQEKLTRAQICAELSMSDKELLQIETDVVRRLKEDDGDDGLAGALVLARR